MPDLTTDLHRRTVLGAACVGCVTLVAGCGSSGTDSAAGTGASSSSAGTAPAPAPASSAPAGGAGAALVALADLKVGEAASATAPDGTKVLVTRTGDATAVAFDARCTHAGCTVAAAGATLACPCHGSKFSAADGSVEHGPAARPLASYAVKVVGGQVLPA